MKRLTLVLLLSFLAIGASAQPVIEEVYAALEDRNIIYNSDVDANKATCAIQRTRMLVALHAFIAHPRIEVVVFTDGWSASIVGRANKRTYDARSRLLRALMNMHNELKKAPPHECPRGSDIRALAISLRDLGVEHRRIHGSVTAGNVTPFQYLEFRRGN